MDIFDKIDETKGGVLGKYQNMAHGYFAFPKLEGEIGPHMRFRGKDVLNWSIENYLGLANMPEIRTADADATTKWGLAYPMGARMISGQTSMHEKLEDEIATFVGKEDAVVVNSSYQAMVSIIDTMCSRFDVIVYDSECHASIMDGVFLHKAKGGKSFAYPHNDIENCRKKLQMAQSYIEKESRTGGILVVTEGLFDVKGDLCELDKLVALKEEVDFRILVDDAHGFGTIGANGKGTAEYYGVQDKIDMIFGVFAKSLAGIGGFIATTEKACDYLRYNMRSQLFSKALPAAITEGLLRRIEILKEQPQLRDQLHNVSAMLRKGLIGAGIEVTNSEGSPIVPVLLRCTCQDEEASLNEALNMVLDIRENYGLFTSLAKHPVVPQGTILLRFVATAEHSDEDVEYTIRSLNEVKNKLDAGEYAKQVPNVVINI
ncbi:MAG: pyridoxal phosphate-dependent aminotransferase family protein [Bacteroidales bacterium]|nr:pyridoxal phosphate-dependent aminotransferase family protein [Bacteroidales bacterium]